MKNSSLSPMSLSSSEFTIVPEEEDDELLFSHIEPVKQRFTQSIGCNDYLRNLRVTTLYKTCVIFMLFLNTAVLIFSIYHLGERHPGLLAAEVLLTLFLAFEVSVRLYLEKKQFFLRPINVVDFILTILCVFSCIAFIFGESSLGEVLDVLLLSVRYATRTLRIVPFLREYVKRYWSMSAIRLGDWSHRFRRVDDHHSAGPDRALAGDDNAPADVLLDDIDANDLYDDQNQHYQTRNSSSLASSSNVPKVVPLSSLYPSGKV